jgi:hypothetical protein
MVGVHTALAIQVLKGPKSVLGSPAASPTLKDEELSNNFVFAVQSKTP